MGIRREQFYIYLSSDYNKVKFANNTASSFVNIIQEKVQLTGSWEVAVTDIKYYPEETVSFKPQPVYVLCDFVKRSHTPLCTAGILKRFYLDRGWESISAPIINPEYHEVSAASLTSVRLYIVDADMEPVQLAAGLLAVTLHFRQK